MSAPPIRPEGARRGVLCPQMGAPALELRPSSIVAGLSQRNRLLSRKLRATHVVANLSGTTHHFASHVECFHDIAWYGHLKFTDRPLWLAILVSWCIAFIEYCLAVPANRYGSFVYTPAQLKTMQEVITLVVFAVFSVFYLKASFTLNHLIGFALIAAGAFFVFKGPL
jgi:uncharacterized protein (DUF486 family)